MSDHIETDDFLAHYGVLGMKWGKHKNNPTSFKDLRAKDKAGRAADKVSRKAANEKRNSEIDAARERINSGAQRKEYKQAKATFKAETYTKGRYAAQKTFNAVKEKHAEEYLKSKEIKSGKETALYVAGFAGATLLSALASAK